MIGQSIFFNHYMQKSPYLANPRPLESVGRQTTGDRGNQFSPPTFKFRRHTGNSVAKPNCGDFWRLFFTQDTSWQLGACFPCLFRSRKNLVCIFQPFFFPKKVYAHAYWDFPHVFRVRKREKIWGRGAEGKKEEKRDTGKDKQVNSRARLTFSPLWYTQEAKKKRKEKSGRQPALSHM